MSALLFEIGCEEIPARMLPEAIASLRELLTQALDGAGLGYGTVETHGTPKRLVAMVEGLDQRQRDSREQRRGPAADKAFTPDGQPTPATLGFARSCGAEVKELERLETPKGSYLAYTVCKAGQPAAQVLPALLGEVMKKLPWPKAMRWGVAEGPFVRPVHALTALLDGAVLTGTIMEGYVNGDQVQGHRFMGRGPHTVRDAATYRQVLADHKVVLALDERMTIIRQGVDRLAADAGGRAILDEGLLSENACLVEWPAPLLGQFDEKFLEIPKEVLVTSMKNHQKYFPVEGSDGRLLPNFVVISNMETRDQGVLVQGFQRVLRARLEDAAFYWQEDRKHPLERRLESLDGVVFQAKLGTVGAKVQRLVALAQRLAPVTGAEAEVCAQAARLSKCDLITGMVGEFPELQGVMGAYYALHDGVTQVVATAIREHYLPQGAADALPVTPAGTALALADKLDTLTGCFGINLVPTGAKDPFALRRAALGVIRMTLAGDLRLSLREALGAAYDGYAHGRLTRSRAETVEALLTFFYGRLQSHLKADGFDYDLIEAVQALGLDDLTDGVARVKALAEFRQTTGRDGAYASLVAANKRMANLLEKSAAESARPERVDGALLKEEAERNLAAALDRSMSEVARLVERGEHGAALARLATLREPIDAFFDQVMVMVEDVGLRGNRLALLAGVREGFRLVADITRLVLPEEEK